MSVASGEAIDVTKIVVTLGAPPFVGVVVITVAGVTGGVDVVVGGGGVDEVSVVGEDVLVDVVVVDEVLDVELSDVVDDEVVVVGVADPGDPDGD